MKILGVRSFGIKGTGEIIKFQAPLTLIVGYNGSGKTTIIECLKFATTGQLPPNSKGGAFVHDPKLCGEKEVMAQVKVQFRNAIGAKLVVTRSLAVTQKKTSLSQTALECQLVMTLHGERTSMSKRVAELNTIVPQNLGVSAAILESVIFCHQDESLWPMSEPSALKKKFDEIFEAQKYTKAIDNLKILRKAKAESLKLLQSDEGHAKVLKDKSERVQSKSTELQDEIEALRVRAESLERDMESALALSKEKREQSHKALGIVESLRTKNERAINLKETLETLKTNLEEIQESDDWLTSTLEQYEERMTHYKTQEAEFTSEYQELQQNMRDSHQRLSEKQAEQGRLQAAKDHYESQLQARVELVREAAHSHSIRDHDGDLDEDRIREFVSRVQKLSQEKDRELERIQKQRDEELSETQTVLEGLRNRRSTRTQERVSSRQAIASNDNKVKLRQQEADRIKMDKGTVAALEASLKDIQSRIRNLTSLYEKAAWDVNLNTETTHLQQLEEESNRLRNELLQSTKLSDERAQLKYAKNSLKNEQLSLSTNKSAYNDQLSALIGESWQPDSLEQDFQIVLVRCTKAVADAKLQQERLLTELSETNMKLKTTRAALVTKKDQKQTFQVAVLASITRSDGRPITNVDEYEPELEDLRAQHEELQKDYDGMSYVSDWYKKCLDAVAKHDACRLCERKFTDKKEKTSALEKINKQLAKLAKEELEKELSESTQILKNADAARTQYDIYKTLSDFEIPALEKEMKKIENEKIPLVRQLEQQDNYVSETETSKADAESLSNIVKKIVNNSAEILKHQTDIARFSSQQKLSGNSLSLEEIEQQNQACEERKRAQNAKIKNLTNDKEHAKSTLTNLEREDGVMLNKLEKARNEMEKKQALLADVEELRENNLQQRESMQTIDADLESLIPQVRKAEAQYENIKQQGQVKEKLIRADKEKLSSTINNFKLVEKTINAYIDQGGPGKLVACQRAIKVFGQDQTAIEGEISQVTTKANDLKNIISDSDKTKRSLNDNITYRKARRGLEAVQKEIAELDERSINDDYKELVREYELAEKRYQKYSAERGVIIGSMSAKDHELDGLVTEYEKEYKDAATKYKELHIKVATTKAVVEDIAKCTKAVDSAIMKYHTVKMEEINNIAADLWRRTYQGTDVDTIMIRSENENSTSKRASYNYRVVMVKQDAEMDMRGRCSAGQKVLASIIVRLALAECFGINCGVIALDEPTTNLDSDNIKALAESLHKIIKDRKHQSNFQLIIITHDEEFLTHMNCLEFTDHYYRVSRDADQKSIIERQMLTDIM